jgi:predicted Zn-dependent protease
MTSEPPELPELPSPEHDDELYLAFREAELFFRADQPTGAARRLEPLVAAHPGNAAVLELYARALFASAQLERAEEALRALTALRPDDGWAQLALARTLERQGRAEEAARHRHLARALGQDG